MATWKRVVLEGEQQNIGQNNLTLSDSERILTMSAASGTPTAQFRVNYNPTYASQDFIRIQNTPTATAGCYFGGSAGGGSAGNKTVIYGDSGAQNLTIDGTGSTLVTDKFVVQNNNNTQYIHPNLTLYKNSTSPADFDYLGAIRFKGNSIDATDNTTVISDEEYAKIYARQLDVSDDSKDSSITLQVNQNDTQKDFIFGVEPDNSSQAYTSRENILRTISVHGTSNTLEHLNRRYRATYQFGLNADIVGTNTTTYQFARGINGVNHSSTIGYIMPYAGWVTGMALVGRRDSGSNQYEVGIRIFNIDSNSLVWDDSNIQSGTTDTFKLSYKSNYNKSTDQIAHYVAANSRLYVQIYVRDLENGSTTIDNLAGSFEYYYEIPND